MSDNQENNQESQEEKFARLMGEVMKSMSLYLLQLATDDEGPKLFETCKSGEVMHLRVKNSEGEVCLQVSGKDVYELAWQYVLHCFHNISIDELKALHKRPLRRALEVKKGKGSSCGSATGEARQAGA